MFLLVIRLEFCKVEKHFRLESMTRISFSFDDSVLANISLNAADPLTPHPIITYLKFGVFDSISPYMYIYMYK